MSKLVSPHGGTLVDRIVTGSKAEQARQESASLPRLTLDSRELADLELVATGAASPLTGFMGSTDYHGVVADMRLADGTVWPLPITLSVPDAAAGAVQPGSRVGLYDAEDRLWAILDVSEVYERDLATEARLVYGTEDDAHPGVKYLLSRPTRTAAGTVDVLPLPEDLPLARYRRPPRVVREEIAKRGWERVAGFQTRNPIHRAHEHLTKLALEFADGLVIHPLIGETKSDDVPADVRFRAYQALIDKYYPSDRILLSAFPAAMRYAGPREAIFHALVRKNYGITSLIIGRDHAGVGKYYGQFDAQRIFERFTHDELGVTPLKFDATFFCRACDALASTRTCPHDASDRLELSGSRVREILRTGEHLPAQFTRPEVEEVLREHYMAESGGAEATAPAVRDPARATKPAAPAAGGFILWFTGLSGAGKSTLAEAVRERLSTARHVEILDGDEVRTYLSKGLGFSKSDRDDNIRRIGFVARILARNGVATITAAISPYAEVRNEVRSLAGREGVPFVEIFARATLDALVERDVKGLYKKALAGEIKNFTGVSDPYEPPENPEIVAETDRETVEASVDRIIGWLRDRRLLA